MSSTDVAARPLNASPDVGELGTVTVAEKLPADGLGVLTEAGCEVIDASAKSRDELLASLGDSVALIVRSATTVDAELLDSAPALKVIGRAGVGVDNIDVAEATKRGLIVVNAPIANVVSAAEHAVAMILASARNLAHAHGALAEGRWDRSLYTGVELQGKTLGIVGLGRIGREVALRARSFGMVVVAYDPYLDATHGAPDGVQLMKLDMLAEQSDFVTLHVAKTPETAGLVNSEFIALMKPGSRIVNVARGGLIEEAALLAALESGHLAGAAVDVYESEPVTDSPYFAHPKIVATPHLGASTVEAQDRAARIVAEQVATALLGQIPTFAINLDAAAVPESARPYLSVARKLGTLVGSLAGAERGDTVEFGLLGDLARHEASGLLLEVQRGVASALEGRAVSLVEAPTILANANIAITPVTHSEVGDHPGAITARFAGRCATMTISQSAGDIRLVDIDGHRISVPVGEHLAIIKNTNQPGVIAAIATTLANAGVNIANMAVGLTTIGDVAVMAVGTDVALSDDVAADVCAAAGLISLDRTSVS